MSSKIDKQLGSLSDSQIPHLGWEIQETDQNSESLVTMEERANLPEFYTFEELENLEFKVKPVIYDLLFKGNISIIGAKPKVGKSTLMRFAAKCVSNGDDFLGRKTIESKVLYLALEEPLANVKRDFKAMGVIKKKNLFISTLFKETDRLLATEKLIKRFKPSLVIIDTMIHITKIGDLNDYGDTTSALKKFRDLAESYDCHILLVHHSRKGESSGNDSAILGSTGLLGAVDLIMQLESDRDKVRLLSSNGRSGLHFDRSALLFDGSNLSFSISSEYVHQAQNRIFAAVIESPGICREVLQEQLKIRSEELTRALAFLEEEGLITYQKENRTKKYFPFTPDETDGGEA